MEGRSPFSLPSLYFSVVLLFLLPRLSPITGGAVDDGGRGEGPRGRGGARGRSGVLIGRLIAVVLPLCESPGS